MHLEGQILIFVCIFITMRIGKVVMRSTEKYYVFFVCICCNQNRQGGHMLEGQILLIFVCIYYSGGYKKRYDPVGDLYKRAYKPNDPRSLFRAVYGYRK